LSNIKVNVVISSGISSSCNGGETGHVLVLSVVVVRAAVTVIESCGGNGSGSIKEGRERDWRWGVGFCVEIDSGVEAVFLGDVSTARSSSTAALLKDSGDYPLVLIIIIEGLKRKML
jgi:hypothetical protein